MTSLQIFFLAIAIFSFCAMAIIIIRANRRPIADSASPIIDGASLAEIVACGITVIASGLIRAAERSLVAVYLFLLLVGYRIAGAAKSGLHKIENRFSTLIETVPGRGRRSFIEKRRGAASFFLEQIKIDKTEAPRRVNRR